ncbi:uncharacterized protein LOC135223524 isoform X3 [Macrobrachium nipponense]|uniref:uncharacterized protein LOC135223524 isoform X3 n=1 Tax=Macrobrachium nipponense TaxID=159736 RepID=UPI0030C7C745
MSLCNKRSCSGSSHIYESQERCKFQQKTSLIAQQKTRYSAVNIMLYADYLLKLFIFGLVNTALSGMTRNFEDAKAVITPVQSIYTMFGRERKPFIGNDAIYPQKPEDPAAQSGIVLSLSRQIMSLEHSDNVIPESNSKVAVSHHNTNFSKIFPRGSQIRLTRSETSKDRFTVDDGTKAYLQQNLILNGSHSESGKSFNVVIQTKELHSSPGVSELSSTVTSALTSTSTISPLEAGEEVTVVNLHSDGIITLENIIDVPTNALPTLQQFSVCTRFRLEHYSAMSSFASYYAEGEANELYFGYKHEGVISVFCCHSAVALHVQTPGPPAQLMKWNDICLVLDLKARHYHMMMNGEIWNSTIPVKKKSDETEVVKVIGGGRFVIGNDMDSLEGDFAIDQAMKGELANYVFYDSVLTPQNMKDYATCQTKVGGLEPLYQFSASWPISELKGKTSRYTAPIESVCPKKRGRHTTVHFQYKMGFSEANRWCGILKGSLEVPENDEEHEKSANLAGRFMKQCTLGAGIYWLGIYRNNSGESWRKMRNKDTLSWDKLIPATKATDAYTCAVVLSTVFKNNWSPVPCDDRICPICRFEEQPTFRLRGLCRASKFDKIYTLKNNREGDPEFLGFFLSKIHLVARQWVMKMTSNESGVYAVTDPGPLYGYPIGRRIWTIEGDECQVDKPDEMPWVPGFNVQSEDRTIATNTEKTTVLFVQRDSPPLEKTDISTIEDDLFEGDRNTLVLMTCYSLVFSCQFNLRRYPFDTQVCSVLYLGNQFNTDIRYVIDSVEFIGNRRLLEYELTNVSSEIVKINKEMAIKVALEFKNQYAFYIGNAFMPSGLLIIICYLTFVFDLDDFQDRIMVSLTSLLVLAGFLTQTNQSVPHTAYLKFIDVWYACLIILNFTMVITQVAVEVFRLQREKKKENEAKLTVISRKPLRMFEVSDSPRRTLGHSSASALFRSLCEMDRALLINRGAIYCFPAVGLVFQILFICLAVNII